MGNMGTKIKNHNNHVLNGNSEAVINKCNCRIKENCPLEGNCLEKSIVYQCTVSTSINMVNKEMEYRGATEGEFKNRHYNHTSSFNNIRYKNNTELSKYVWRLKEDENVFSMTWKKLDSAKAYNNSSKRCNLCLTEKLHILEADKQSLLNKRSELISKCRHENKYYLRTFEKT